MTVSCLDELARILKEVKSEKYRGINFFQATDLVKQERKHSKILVWLLQSGNKHGLRDKFLVELCKRLINYTTIDDGNNSIKQNKDILLSANVISEKTLTDLAVNQNITATAEYPTDNGRYLDILVDIKETQTVIVIENKLDSTVHDDQLADYFDFIQNRSTEFMNYKHKVCIYLTEFGELPYNTSDKQYNNKWCALSYNDIICVISELIDYARNSDNKKLQFILEDYKEMVDTEILKKSKPIRKKCEEILRDKDCYDGFQLLDYYLKNYATYENVLNFCKDWLQDENKSGLVGVDIIEESPKSFSFLTHKMETEFLRLGESAQEYRKHWRCLCGSDNAIAVTGYIHIMKLKSDSWSNAQRKVIDLFDPNTTCDTQVAYGEGKARNVTLSPQDDREKEVKEIEKKLVKALSKFVQKIKNFESLLASTE